MRMNIDRNTGICPYFGRNVLDGCIDYHNNMTLGDPATTLQLLHLKDLPCLSLVLNILECIIHLIESAYTSLILPNLDRLISISVPPDYLYVICYFDKLWEFLTYDGFKSHVNFTEGF